MKNFLNLIALALAMWAAACFQEAGATHLVGSDIVYRCLGNGQYQIIVRVYRDCNGIQLSQSPIELACSTHRISITNQTLTSVRDITGIDPVCNIQSRCSGTYPFGIEEHIYTATVDLSTFNCCEWTISWQQNARGSNISTGPANQNFYTTATLNKCVTPCNSSPDFTNPPVALVCVNQDFCFNNGALDTLDIGDSLSYHFAPALIGPNAQATYIPPHSPNYPITGFGPPNTQLPLPAGIHLDPVTGDLCFRPTRVNQVAIVVIEVKEWRKINGVMTVIGTTRRDMQIIVIPCPNNKVPKILPPYSKQACAGQTVCIPITTTDEDPNDTVRISWNRGIPGASFTHNNGQVKRASGEVCWTPTEDDISNIPYTFTITAKDNACVIPGQTTRSFSIFVRDTPKATRDIRFINCGKAFVSYTPLKNYSGITSNWTIRDSLNRAVWSSTRQQDTAFLQPGWHRVFLTLQTVTPCINIHIDSLYIPPFLKPDIGPDTFVCGAQSFLLQSKVRDGVAPIEYNWFRVVADTAEDHLGQNTTLNIDPDHQSRYLLQVKDAIGCVNYDSVTVREITLPSPDLGPDKRICDGDQVLLSSGYDSTYRFAWNTGDNTPEIQAREAGIYSVRVIDSLGCHQTDSFELLVNKIDADAGFNQLVCEKDTAHLTGKGGDLYRWFNSAQFGLPGATPLQSGATYSFVVNTTTELILEVTKTESGLTCINTDTVLITRRNLPIVNLVNGGPLCENEITYDLMPMVQAPTLLSGTWKSNSVPDAIGGNNFNPSRAGASSGNGHPVIYQVRDAFGCRNEATAYVRVSPKPRVELLDSTAFCGDEKNIRLNQLRVYPISTGGGQAHWYSATGSSLVNQAIQQSNPSNPLLDVSRLPQGTTVLLGFSFVNTTTGCAWADTIPVKVKPVPATNLTGTASVCWNEDKLNLETYLQATPPGGSWSGSSGAVLSNGEFLPSSVGDAAKHLVPGTSVQIRYKVILEGCAAEDSATMIVKGIPQLTLTLPVGLCSDAQNIDLNQAASPGGGLWEGNGVSGNLFSPALSGAGTHPLKYSYTASNGCAHELFQNILVQEAPSLQLMSPDRICAGDILSAEVQSNGSYGLWWSTSGDGEFDQKGSGNTGSSLAKTTYFAGSGDLQAKLVRLLISTTNNGYCQAASREKVIRITPLPQTDLLADPVKGCAPLEVHFTGNHDQGMGAHLHWNLGNGRTENGSETLTLLNEVYPIPGEYTATFLVVGPDAEGACQSEEKQIKITVLPTPEAAFDASRWSTSIALPGIQFTDKSTIDAGARIIRWDWSFGDNNQGTSTKQHPYYEYPSSNENDTGRFEVLLRVEADNGCWDTQMGSIHIRPDLTVFIPNAFSPNGYGHERNNRFYVVADNFASFEIRIYTRWGEEVYRSTRIDDGWDGKYKGKEAQQDVYVYVVNVTSESGKAYEYHGTITLLR